MFNLDKKLEGNFVNTIWGKELMQEVEDSLIDAISTLQVQAKKLALEPDLEKYYQTILNDIDILEKLKNNLDNWDKS